MSSMYEVTSLVWDACCMLRVREYQLVDHAPFEIAWRAA